jgi:hypothetical protein
MAKRIDVEWLFPTFLRLPTPRIGVETHLPRRKKACKRIPVMTVYAVLMAAREAACSCGQLKLVVEGEPLRVSACHCLACQRRTGSAFSFQARFPRDRIEFSGSSHKYTRISDAGERATFSFCPKCGTTVYYMTASAPDLVAVPVGAFADPSFPAPSFSVWEDRKHAWITMPPGIERHA